MKSHNHDDDTAEMVRDAHAALTETLGSAPTANQIRQELKLTHGVTLKTREIAKLVDRGVLAFSEIRA